MSQPQICLIAAVAENGVIGNENKLPWRLRDDLAHFKNVTKEHSVIMGRKTWESLGRPLPHRTNIVITRQQNYAAPGATVALSLEQALSHCEGQDEVFVIGGAEIYALALPIAQRLLISHVATTTEGDACFPNFSAQAFVEQTRQHFVANENNEYAFDVVDYRRTNR